MNIKFKSLILKIWVSQDSVIRFRILWIEYRFKIKSITSCTLKVFSIEFLASKMISVQLCGIKVTSIKFLEFGLVSFEFQEFRIISIEFLETEVISIEFHKFWIISDVFESNILDPFLFNIGNSEWNLSNPSSWTFLFQFWINSSSSYLLTRFHIISQYLLSPNLIFFLIIF